MTTATATVSISGGRLNTVTITNPGLDTLKQNHLKLLLLPIFKKEDVDLITTVEGFDGDIIGVGVTDGVNGGIPLHLNLH